MEMLLAFGAGLIFGAVWMYRVCMAAAEEWILRTAAQRLRDK